MSNAMPARATPQAQRDAAGPTRSVIVLPSMPGAGATTVAGLLQFQSEAVGVPLRPFSLRGQDQRAAPGRTVLRGAEEVAVRPPKAPLDRAALERFDLVAQILAAGGAVVDCSPEGFEWLRAVGREIEPAPLFADAPGVTWVPVVNALPASVARTRRLVDDVVGLADAFGPSNIAVAVCDPIGVPLEGLGEGWVLFDAELRDRKIPRFDIGPIDLRRAEERGFKAAHDTKPADLVSALKITPAMAHAQVHLFKNWVAGTAASARSAGLFAPRKPSEVPA